MFTKIHILTPKHVYIATQLHCLHVYTSEFLHTYEAMHTYMQIYT